MTDSLANYQWLVASRLGQGVEPQHGRDGEALLYYQRALEAEPARVRLQLTAFALPWAHHDGDSVDPAESTVGARRE